MKKKLLIVGVLLVGMLSLNACGQSKIDLSDYLIEQRNNLFVAEDDIYSVSFSSGLREENYALDGVCGDMVEFGIVTLARQDGGTLADDTYTYVITIDGQDYTGFLSANDTDNSYSADIENVAGNDSEVSIQISFTGYLFSAELDNVSIDFAVDGTAALEIANTELQDSLSEAVDDETSIEVVMKILKDYSNSEVKKYYWYIGVISSNADTFGILIDCSTGDVIAKKV